MPYTRSSFKVYGISPLFYRDPRAKVYLVVLPLPYGFSIWYFTILRSRRVAVDVLISSLLSTSALVTLPASLTI